MAGKTFTTSSYSMQANNGYDLPTTVPATVEFVSANQIKVNGVTLTQDPSDGVFYSADKSLQLSVTNNIEGLSTQQILYMLSTQTVTAGSTTTTTLTPMVAGNITTAANLPQGGSASYAGEMTLFDDLGNELSPIGLKIGINFDATPHVTGNFTFGKSYYVELATTTLSNGTFSTTVQSPDSPGEVTGAINGTVFGSTGSEVGGTLALEYNPGGTPSASYVGYYGATQQ